MNRLMIVRQMYNKLGFHMKLSRKGNQNNARNGPIPLNLTIR